MTVEASRSQIRSDDSRWSNRILFLALAGILFLTLYPFRFDFTGPERGHVFPFLLRGWGKYTWRPVQVFADTVLNVLLFVPYGFGVTLKLRGRGLSKAATMGLVLAAGALLSYTVELLQFYIPQRDSGWEDVVTNSSGAALGFFLVLVFGAPILRFLSARERSIDTFLTLPRLLALFLIYVGLWFAFTVPLQRQVGLANWNRDSFLMLGSRASGRPPSSWKGEISRIEVWDRALPGHVAREITSGLSNDPIGSESLVSYDLSGSPPFHDQRGYLSDLDWAPNTAAATGVVLDGEAWLVSRTPVSALVNDIRRTKQFSLRVVCRPSDAAGPDRPIVSISDAWSFANFELREDRSHLIVWFRNAILVKWPGLSWNHPDVFAPQQPRDILVSYNGLVLSVYVDGQRQRSPWEFSAGTALAFLVHRHKTAELIGYRYIYYVIIFWPAGCLLGLAWRRMVARPLVSAFSLFFGALLLCGAFEMFIVRLSGRPLAFINIVFSMSLMIAAGLWVNSDGKIRSVDSPVGNLAR